MTYDPEARRDTPLALKLKERIRRDGPITVAQYMEACLQDPEHGYYRTKTAIGAQGDFVTAPEISQVFGELIGLWCAVVWQQMGAPETFNLVELGPGRGTLMADALRATRIVPGFHDAVEVHLVESSRALRAAQEEALAGVSAKIFWHDTLASVPAARTIIVANEFLDALPVDQFMVFPSKAGPRDWRGRDVNLDSEGRLCFSWSPLDAGDSHLQVIRLHPQPPDEVICELPAGRLLFEELREFAGRSCVAGLFVDYGYIAAGTYGQSLQAVRNHECEHILTSPGEADLSAHVDFDRAYYDLLKHEFAVDGPVTQANFLGALGIMQRAAKLMSLNPAKAHDIEAGIARLMAVPGMGDRFKAIGIRSASLPPLPGFEEANS